MIVEISGSNSFKIPFLLCHCFNLKVDLKQSNNITQLNAINWFEMETLIGPIDTAPRKTYKDS